MGDVGSNPTMPLSPFRTLRMCCDIRKRLTFVLILFLCLCSCSCCFSNDDYGNYGDDGDNEGTYNDASGCVLPLPFNFSILQSLCSIISCCCFCFRKIRALYWTQLY